MLKIAVCTPWFSPFMYTAYVDAQLNLKHPQDCEITFIRGLGWCPARRHIDMCEKALKWGADYILITGADQVHPPDMIQRLYNRVLQGAEIITALVPSRGYVGWQEMKPFQRMAWQFKSFSSNSVAAMNDEATHISNAIEVIDPTKADLQEINFIGSGVLMFHRDHLLTLKKPWFFETYNPETYERLACMDTQFVWRLQKEAGARIYCDMTIPVKHAHIFLIDETFPDRFADWTEPGKGDGAICVFAPEEELANVDDPKG